MVDSTSTRPRQPIEKKKLSDCSCTNRHKKGRGGSARLRARRLTILQLEGTSHWSWSQKLTSTFHLSAARSLYGHIHNVVDIICKTRTIAWASAPSNRRLCISYSPLPPAQERIGVQGSSKLARFLPRGQGSA